MNLVKTFLSILNIFALCYSFVPISINQQYIHYFCMISGKYQRIPQSSIISHLLTQYIGCALLFLLVAKGDVLLSEIVIHLCKARRGQRPMDANLREKDIRIVGIHHLRRCEAKPKQSSRSHSLPGLLRLRLATTG